ncbi:hypothetical protein TUBRATIS_10350 [Tubulinosema ratisbonensis]|uniref:Uncharacterized protein n=1 Tax=Tubulinosema ratisbonensis TaxID=291195 RepID=A0A437AML7_9MICR|nr:hypothetical protein TUBRATIS_10350 [Tubulinosema ratisbonensis]
MEETKNDHHKPIIEQNTKNKPEHEEEIPSSELQEFIIILRNCWLKNLEIRKGFVMKRIRVFEVPFLVSCRRFLRRNRYISDVLCPILIIFMYLYLYQLICMVTLKEYHAYLGISCYINLIVILFRTLLQFFSILPEFIAKNRIFLIDKSNNFIIFFNFAFMIKGRIMLHSCFPNYNLSNYIQIIVFCLSLVLASFLLLNFHIKGLLRVKFLLLGVYLIILILLTMLITVDKIFIYYICAELLILLIDFISFLTIYENRYWSDNACFSLFFSLHIIFQILTNKLVVNCNILE